MNFESFTFCPSLTSAAIQRYPLACISPLFEVLAGAPLLRVIFSLTFFSLRTSFRFSTAIPLHSFTLVFFMCFSDRLQVVLGTQAEGNRQVCSVIWLICFIWLVSFSHITGQTRETKPRSYYLTIWQLPLHNARGRVTWSMFRFSLA